MTWLSVTLETDCADADALSDALLEAGALSAGIEDADAGTPAETPQFGEPGCLSTPGWKRSSVIALLPAGAKVTEIIAAAAQAIGLDCPPVFSVQEIAEQNWVQLTQAQFDPIRISERLWIVPSWHAAPDPAALNLVLDPGMAFGTGSHPTTRLCLEWLERSVRSGCSLLDYGCGSGILAIAAAKLGAQDVLGVDIDEQAVDAAKNNAQNNHVGVRFHHSAQKIDGTFDVVVANILANPLKALAPAICAHVRPGGCLALSGILAEQSDELIEIYAPYLALSVADSREGWVCLSGQKTQQA